LGRVGTAFGKAPGRRIGAGELEQWSKGCNLGPENPILGGRNGRLESSKGVLKNSRFRGGIRSRGKGSWQVSWQEQWRRNSSRRRGMHSRDMVRENMLPARSFKKMHISTLQGRSIQQDLVHRGVGTAEAQQHTLLSTGLKMSLLQVPGHMNQNLAPPDPEVGGAGLDTSEKLQRNSRVPS
jgi:hypothetical protein